LISASWVDLSVTACSVNLESVILASAAIA
jgi:hypothetical protein